MQALNAEDEMLNITGTKDTHGNIFIIEAGAPLQHQQHPQRPVGQSRTQSL